VLITKLVNYLKILIAVFVTSIICLSYYVYVNVLETDKEIEIYFISVFDELTPLKITSNFNMNIVEVNDIESAVTGLQKFGNIEAIYHAKIQRRLFAITLREFIHSKVTYDICYSNHNYQHVQSKLLVTYKLFSTKIEGVNFDSDIDCVHVL